MKSTGGAGIVKSDGGSGIVKWEKRDRVYQMCSSGGREMGAGGKTSKRIVA